MERFTSRQERSVAYHTTAEFLTEDDSAHLEERARRCIHAVDSLVTYDRDGVAVGLIDETFIDDNGVRRLRGESYQHEKRIARLEKAVAEQDLNGIEVAVKEIADAKVPINEYEEQGVLEGSPNGELREVDAEYVLQQGYTQSAGEHQDAGRIVSRAHNIVTAEKKNLQERLEYEELLLNTVPMDTMAFDDIETVDGRNVGDAIFADERIRRFNEREARGEEEAIARRALIVKVACELMLNDTKTSTEKSSKSA